MNYGRLASQEYGNAYNRQYQNWQGNQAGQLQHTQLRGNALSNLANMGWRNDQANQLGQNYGNQYAAGQQGISEAKAAGIMGAQNALAGGFGNIGNLLKQGVGLPSQLLHRRDSRALLTPLPGWLADGARGSDRQGAATAAVPDFAGAVQGAGVNVGRPGEAPESPGAKGGCRHESGAHTCKPCHPATVGAETAQRRDEPERCNRRRKVAAQRAKATSDSLPRASSHPAVRADAPTATEARGGWMPRSSEAEGSAQGRFGYCSTASIRRWTSPPLPVLERWASIRNRFGRLRTNRTGAKSWTSRSGRGWMQSRRSTLPNRD